MLPNDEVHAFAASGAFTLIDFDSVPARAAEALRRRKRVGSWWPAAPRYRGLARAVVSWLAGADLLLISWCALRGLGQWTPTGPVVPRCWCARGARLRMGVRTHGRVGPAPT